MLRPLQLVRYGDIKISVIVAEMPQQIKFEH